MTNWRTQDESWDFKPRTIACGHRPHVPSFPLAPAYLFQCGTVSFEVASAMAFRFGQQATPVVPAATPHAFPGFSIAETTRTTDRTVTPQATSTVEPPKALRSPTKLSEGVEGTVSFKSRRFASYRYRITTKNDKLRIWLEDIKSKQQWETEPLGLQDFVGEDSVIPMATFQDYTVCFANCLQNTTSPDFACDLAPAEANSDAWILSLTLKLRVFVTEWTPTYTMLLKPVALEPTDVLAAKIRDQEDKIQRLESQVRLLTAKPDTPVATAPAFVIGRSTQATGQNQAIVWKEEGSGNIAFSFHPGGVIQFTVAATFVVQLAIHNNNVSNNTKTVELQLNAKAVSSCKDSNRNGHVQATQLCHVLTTQVGDGIKVVYMGNNQALEGSHILIYQLR